MFFQNFLPLRMAEALKKTIIFFPQSIGPLGSPLAERLFKRLIESEFIIRIFARESTTQAFLQRLLASQATPKVELCPDVAFLLRREVARDKTPLIQDLKRPILAITARSWDFPGSQSRAEKRLRQSDYLSTLAESCLIFHREWQGSIMLVPQVRGPGLFEDDRIPLYRLRERLRRSVSEKQLVYLDLPPAASPSDLLEIFSHADLVLATRFHSAVYGLLAGVPVISIAYQAKASATMEWLGLQEWALDINGLEADGILRLAERILRDDGRLRKTIADQVARARAAIASRLQPLLRSLWKSPKL